MFKKFVDLLLTVRDRLYIDYYVIGCRKITQESDFSFKKNKFNILWHERNYHFADPFLVEDDKTDKVYIFLEMLNLFTGIGKIGISEYTNGQFSRVREVLKEDFHLSYPNVFKINDQWYMIPETNEANDIRLYKTDSFPYGWKYEKTLVKNIKAADTSFLGLYNDNYILYTYDLNNQKCLFFSMNKQSFETTPMQVKGNFSNIRPGGNALLFPKATYRVMQDGHEVYGEFIRIFKTESQLQDNIINESEIKIIQATDIKTDKHRNFRRIHTLNRSKNHECIDLVYKRISLRFFMYTIWHFIKKHLKKK